MHYYYLSAQNQPRGPASEDELRELAQAGIVHERTLIAAVGSQEWVPITTVLTEFPPVRPTFASNRPTEPLAVWALCLGLPGVICCQMVLAPAAVICGHLALGKIQRNPHLDGRGMALAGTILGYIGIALFIVYLITGNMHVRFNSN
jgi:hypothetical protein